MSSYNAASLYHHRTKWPTCPLAHIPTGQLPHHICPLDTFPLCYHQFPTWVPVGQEDSLCKVTAKQHVVIFTIVFP